MTVEANQVMVADKETTLFRNQPFLLLWGAALLSSFGISFFLFAESWYVVNVLGLEASLGLIYVASSVPRLLFMVISGTVADRFSKTKIMFLSVMVRAVLLVGLVVWFIAGGITLWTFVVFALLFGVLDAFFWAAESSVLPTIIDKEQLTRGNSIIQMTNQTSLILAPMLAGLLIAVGSYEIVFGCTALMLFVASLLIYLMRAPKANEGQEDEQKFWASFIEGFNYVKQSRTLVLMLLTTVFLNLFLVGPLTMGLPLFVKTVLEGTAMDFSLLESGLAAGMLVGSVGVGVLNISKNRGKVSIMAIIFGGLAFAGLSMTTVIWMSMVMLGLFGIALSFSNIPIIAAVQSLVEDRMLGRVMGLLSLSSMGLIPVSYALTSMVLATGVAIHHIMLAGALLVVAYSVFVFLAFKDLRKLQ